MRPGARSHPTATDRHTYSTRRPCTPKSPGEEPWRPHPTTQIAPPGVERTYSAREASALLGRSYSWLDQGLRDSKFTLSDGTNIEPRRTAGGYRRFTLAMLEDIALCSYRSHRFSMGQLKSTYRELLVAAHRDTGEYKIPS